MRQITPRRPWHVVALEERGAPPQTGPTVRLGAFFKAHDFTTGGDT
jgi:hypothetical protein